MGTMRVSMILWFLCCVPVCSTSEIVENYSLHDELRMLGATHTLISNDVEGLMKPLRQHGYNAVMVHALDDDWGATYPSQYFPFATWRNFQPGTLKQIINTCHCENIRVIAYVPWIMRTDNSEYLDAQATNNPDRNQKGVASFDSPFRERFAKALLELCELGVDGFWIDGFTMEYCNLPGIHFTHGASIFKLETGLDWPETENWESDTFRRWLKWRYQHHIDNAVWLTSKIHERYPFVTFSFNTHYATPMISVHPEKRITEDISWERWREAVPLSRLPDAIGASAHARLAGSNLSQLTPLWAALISDMNPHRSDIWQPTFAERFDVSRFPQIWNSPQMNISADEIGLRMSALAGFAFKTQVWMEGNIRDGWGANPEMYTQINSALKSRESFFGGERVPHVGILLSGNTRDYWGLRKKHGGHKNTDRFFTEAYLGLVSLLMMEHISFSHIFDNTLNTDTLRCFPVVVLNNVACLSDKDSKTLRDYVENGGKLVATYETSLYDEWGERRNNFALSEVFGVDYMHTEDEDNPDPPIRLRKWNEFSNTAEKGFAWQTRTTRISCHENTLVLAEEIGSPSMGLSKSAEVQGQPVIVKKNFGKGECIYISDDVFQSYYIAPFRSIRRMVRYLVNLEEAPFQVDAPSQIITTGFWQNCGRRLVIHFVNLPSTSTRLFENSQRDILDDIVPVDGIRVRIKDSRVIQRATLLPAGVELTPTQQGSLHTEFTIPRVAEHEMLIIDFQ